MNKKLLIVESPSKCSTIKTILGKNYEVIASRGHISQVEQKQGAMSVDDTIHIKWINDKTKSNYLIKSIKTIKPDEIILATDLDREGEAISWHIQELLKTHKLDNIPTVRITFNEITKKAILNALKNPRCINMDLINAYITRLFVDFQIGFSGSKLLWTFLRVFRNQSAGRVQSPTLGILTNKEREIATFIPQKYYKHKLLLDINGLMCDGQLSTKDQQALETDKVFLESMLAKIPNKSHINSIKEKIIQNSPSEPFITSTLQQAANSKLNLSVAKTMQLAQTLYEGVKINGEPKALITYMRTDSCSMSADSVQSIRTYIQDTYGDKYLNESVIEYSNNKINTQEAHECIRPVDVNITPAHLTNVDKNLVDLYEIIWARSISSQMSKSITKHVTLEIDSHISPDITIVSKTSYLIFDGFKILQDTTLGANNVFSNIEKGAEVLIKDKAIEEAVTKPPARYSEAKLVAEMEKLGIGRPSTYGYVIDTLKKRNYIYVKNKSIHVTEKGIITYYFLYHFFTKYIDYLFTSNMENDLNKICTHEADHLHIVKTFDTSLSHDINQTKSNININIISKEVLDIVHLECSKCGSKNLELQQKFSFFFRCVDCKAVININTQKFQFDGAELIINSSYKLLLVGEKKIYLPDNYEIQESDLELLKTFPIKLGNYDITSTSSGFLMKQDKKIIKTDLNGIRDFIAKNN